MKNYEICEVKTSNEKKMFIKMAHAIYDGCEHWVAPLESDINIVFDEKKNKMFNGGEAIRFLLYDKSDNNKCVGRIAAFYNTSTSHNPSDENLKIGGCGFFESINSQEVANMLFDKAKEWLLSKGLNTMEGPINFGDREFWWGMLAEGFDAPIYGMNYNHPYYRELFENYGFKNYFEAYTFLRDLRNAELNPVVQNNAQRLERNPAYRFEHISKKNLDKVAVEFCEIYRSAWEKFEGIAEITQEDARNLVKKLSPIIDEKLIYFAYFEDKPIGFFVMIPDINSVIKPFKGKMNLINGLRFFCRLKIKKITRNAIGMIFGVVSDFQGKGVESAMMNVFRKQILKGGVNYDFMTLSWVGDFNPLMVRMVEKYVEAKRNKTYITYRYIFDREYPFERAKRVSVTRNKK